ncbi:MAG TPA: histone deacetylase, partial [Thermoplasmata archaeon]|nr:histone deacetylase [Thermoplasmata archaeon]
MTPATVVYDKLYSKHRQHEGHPERPERLEALLEGVAAAQSSLQAPEALLQDHEAELPRLVHSPTYVEAIRHFGEGRYDPDTWVHPETFGIAVRAAAGAVHAANLAMAGTPAFALLRPPGHHAGPDNAAGFCYFNNIAIAAQHLIKSGAAKKVAIVDIDVHHGDGTERIFESRTDVLYISTHQWPHYPGTGAVDVCGRGEGEGFNVNIPLPAGSGDATYQLAFERVVEPVLGEFRPDVILVSLGFDAHTRDPLADLTLSTSGYAECCRRILQFGALRCGSRVACLLEGGYDLAALEDCGEAVARTLAGETPKPR